jgi:hypothetical protein
MQKEQYPVNDDFGNKKGGGTLNITGNFNHAISCDDDIILKMELFILNLQKPTVFMPITQLT